MKIEYDKEIDAKYVRIKDGKISYTKAQKDWLIFDYNENNEVLGVEILDVSKHQIAISVIDQELVSCSEIKSNSLINGNEREFGFKIDTPQSRFSMLSV